MQGLVAAGAGIGPLGPCPAVASWVIAEREGGGASVAVRVLVLRAGGGASGAVRVLVVWAGGAGGGLPRAGPAESLSKGFLGLCLLALRMLPCFWGGRGNSRACPSPSFPSSSDSTPNCCRRFSLGNRGLGSCHEAEPTV